MLDMNYLESDVIVSLEDVVIRLKSLAELPTQITSRELHDLIVVPLKYSLLFLEALEYKMKVKQNGII